ncbi:MAG: flagellar basal body-associated FliL family protein [Pseudomonadota bacterium]
MDRRNDTAEQVDPTEGADGGRSVGKLAIAMALVTSLCAGAAAGFFLAPSPQTQHASVTSIDGSLEKGNDENTAAAKKKKEKTPSKKEKKKKQKKSNDKKKSDDEQFGAKGVSTFISGNSAFVEFPPLLVSVRSKRSPRHVKIRIVIETTPEDSEAFAIHSYHIIDTLNTYLRTIDIAQFEDPTMLSVLKERIAHRARLVAPEAVIHEVLVTEFLLS